MKAMKAIKVSNMKIRPKTMIKIYLLYLKLNIELHRMLWAQKKAVYSTDTLKKRKKTCRVKIKIKMMTTMKTALTMAEIVLQMTRMKMDLLLLLLAIPLPRDYYSIKNWNSTRNLLARERSYSKWASGLDLNKSVSKLLHYSYDQDSGKHWWPGEISETSLLSYLVSYI